jgi:hypothetical protein
MTEWWTYGLSDFLMFSPQAYWRLVARHNDAWWPAQLAGLVSAFALVVMLRETAGWAQRIVLWVLAAAWAWVGWSFFWLRYSEIFLAAPLLAQVCGAQALMLATAASLPVATHREVRAPTRIAATLLGAVALAYPLLAWATGHRWIEAEVFGFMPDPTALATLAALLGASRQTGPERALLAVLPLLVLLLGGLTRSLIGA